MKKTKHFVLIKPEAKGVTMYLAFPEISFFAVPELLAAPIAFLHEPPQNY
jgi:hypothetical protein